MTDDTRQEESDVHSTSAGCGVPRRNFLLLLGAGIGLAGLLLRFRTGFSRLARPRAASAAADETRAGELTPAEMDTLTALGFVLIPSSFAKGAPGARENLVRVSEAVIRDRLTELAETASGADDLRTAAAFLDARSRDAHGVPLAQLDFDRRRTLIEEILRPYTARTLFTNPYYYVTDFGRHVRRLWSSTARPVVLEFYAHDLGWRTVGYSRRPGQCGNLEDYQFPVSAS